MSRHRRCRCPRHRLDQARRDRAATPTERHSRPAMPGTRDRQADARRASITAAWWLCPWVSTPPMTANRRRCHAGHALPLLFAAVGRGTPRSGSVDKPVMGASRAGSYEVTPPGRSRAITPRRAAELLNDINNDELFSKALREHRPVHDRIDRRTIRARDAAGAVLPQELPAQRGAPRAVPAPLAHPADRRQYHLAGDPRAGQRLHERHTRTNLGIIDTPIPWLTSPDVALSRSSW